MLSKSTKIPAKDEAVKRRVLKNLLIRWHGAAVKKEYTKDGDKWVKKDE